MIPAFVATLAPIVNTIQIFPQIYKTYQTKSVEDLSLFFLLLFFINTILWLLHGYFINDQSLIIAGIIAGIMNIILLVMYFIYRKRSSN
jgi:MtN3 and saliva related transmembrane protein